MKVELQEVNAVKKAVRVEVGPDEVERETRDVLRDYQKKARLPGFRAGKAPIELIRTRFGAAVREDVRDRLLSRTFHAAAEQSALRPLGDPAVDELSFDDGGPLRYRATFEVVPPIVLRAHRGVELRRTRPRLEPVAVERALEDLRQARARLVVDPERVAAAGDVIVADVDGAPREGATPFHRERMPIEVGAAGSLPAFDERLVGARAGTEVSFAVDYPPQHPNRELAGRTVDFRLQVHEVKRRELPALDDEFARDLGEFADLAALRERVREDLQARHERDETRASREALLDRVLLENPIPLPDVLVEREIRQRLEDFVRGLILQGIDPEKSEIDWETLRKRHEPIARKSVHAALILDAVAAEERLAVDGAALEQRIRDDARRLGEPPDKLRERLNQRGALPALRAQLLRERALDYLISVANIHYSE